MERLPRFLNRGQDNLLRARLLVSVVAFVLIVGSTPTVLAGDAPLPSLRVERLDLAAGAELISVHGRGADGEDVPLVAVLNDTLGDRIEENDRLRYVWIFSTTEPTLAQRALSCIPFFYRGASNRAIPADAPPVRYDFTSAPATLWRTILWNVVSYAVVEPRGWIATSGAETYVRNEREAREANLRNALGILAMGRETDPELAEVLDDDELAPLYAKLVGSGLAGLFITEEHAADAYERNATGSRERVARNWELLRQRCEEESLFFDPLPAPPMRARHAVVWVSLDELGASERDRSFDSRFLNISSPWSDANLRAWEGYSKTFYVAEDGRYLREWQPGASAVEMVPLAVYGLDFPKIPALLVDFRSVFNPKRRELSHRVIDDVTSLLNATPYGRLEFVAIQNIYSLMWRRKGVDVDQPSRALSYAQLRSLLLVKNDLDAELQEIVTKGLQKLSVNPLNRDLVAEQLARHQFASIREQVYAGALDERIERDRAREMVRHAHGRFTRALLGIARYATFGIYTHRDDSPALRDRHALALALERHRSVLEEIAAAPRPVEVTWSPDRIEESLDFIARNGEGADERIVRAIDEIARKSDDVATRSLAVEALHRIDTSGSRAVLARMATDENVAADTRADAERLSGVAPEPREPEATSAATFMITPALRP